MRNRLYSGWRMNPIFSICKIEDSIQRDRKLCHCLPIYNGYAVYSADILTFDCIDMWNLILECISKQNEKGILCTMQSNYS